MAFVGKVEQLRRDAFPLQNGKEVEAFVDRDAEVQFVVDDQVWRLEIAGEPVR